MPINTRASAILDAHSDSRLPHPQQSYLQQPSSAQSTSQLHHQATSASSHQSQADAALHLQQQSHYVVEEQACVINDAAITAALQQERTTLDAARLQLQEQLQQQQQLLLQFQQQQQLLLQIQQDQQQQMQQLQQREPQPQHQPLSPQPQPRDDLKDQHLTNPALLTNSHLNHCLRTILDFGLQNSPIYQHLLSPARLRHVTHLHQNLLILIGQLATRPPVSVYDAFDTHIARLNGIITVLLSGRLDHLPLDADPFPSITTIADLQHLFPVRVVDYLLPILAYHDVIHLPTPTSPHRLRLRLRPQSH
jgi:hypothetical protein